MRPDPSLTKACPAAEPANTSAAAFVDLGCMLLGEERYSEALIAFTQAEAIGPDYPLLRAKIVYVHVGLGNYATALEIAERLVQENPRDSQAWAALSWSARKNCQWEKALRAAQRAFRLDNSARNLYSLAMLMGEFGRFTQKRYLLESALYLDRENPYYLLELALLQLRDQDYANGWRNFQARLVMRKHTRFLLNNKMPLWKGESLDSAILVLMPELGLGDDIAYVRYAVKVAERAAKEGGMILLCCWEELESLFAGGLAEYGDVVSFTTLSKGMVLQPYHFRGRRTFFQSTLLSLPLALSETVTDQFPYLTANPHKVEAWKTRLGNDVGLKVGLAWTGRQDHERNALRSIPIFEFLDALKDIPSVTFYSLQKGQSEVSRAAGLIDFSGEWKSFDDSAAFMSCLDLVIAIDCVIAHLAGALAIPTLVLADINSHFYWGREGANTPWYPGVRVYRQRKMCNWTTVFEGVSQHLAELAPRTSLSTTGLGESISKGKLVR